MKATSVNGPSFVQMPASVVNARLPSAGDVPLLPAPSDTNLGGASIEQLAMLLTRADEQDRNQARALQQTADAAATAEDSQQVQAMRQKADSDRDAAIWSGAGDIVAGAFTAASACVDAPAQGAASGTIDWHAALEAGAKASPGVAAIVSGGCKASGEQDDASAAQSGASAQADLRRYDEARDDAQAASDSIQKVEQFLDQILETQNATRLAAASLRA